MDCCLTTEFPGHRKFVKRTLRNFRGIVFPRKKPLKNFVGILNSRKKPPILGGHNTSLNFSLVTDHCLPCLKCRKSPALFPAFYTYSLPHSHILHRPQHGSSQSCNISICAGDTCVATVMRCLLTAFPIKVTSDR